MSLNKLLRKKDIGQIQKQVEQGMLDCPPDGLARHLSVRDLTAFGIAAIIGAGIFSTIGRASADGGPAVIFLFIFTAIACGFAAFAYAEFASMVPVSGSAYTYSYVAFGELAAWIIGWALIMEYAIGNITVAFSWSDYFTGLLSSMDIHIAPWLSTDHLSASKAYEKVSALLLAGKNLNEIDPSLVAAYHTWLSAPSIPGLHIIFDLPAIAIVALITSLVFRGIKESKNAGNLMVFIKMAVVLLVIIIGAFYVDVSHWSPFAPNGVGGVLKGVSAVFFAYIGFDAISTTAEECKNPQRDLPRGMMYSIIICTILYVAIALVLTGMVSYQDLNVGDPLAFVFEKLNLAWLSGIIAVSAVVAMASVLLVFQLGQPRIWMSMSRDGLLPPMFSKIHPKFKTPYLATIVTGLSVALPTFFVNSELVTDLCSIGTLFAFVLVCAGVLRLGTQSNVQYGKFRIPYLNSRIIAPLALLASLAFALLQYPQKVNDFVNNNPQIQDAEIVVSNLSSNEIGDFKMQAQMEDSSRFKKFDGDLLQYLQSLNESEYAKVLAKAPVDNNKKVKSGWSLFKHKIPYWIFYLVCLVLTYFAIRYQLSLIPLLGLISCLYLMCGIPVISWAWFGIWLSIGLVIYFSYGYKRSKLNVRI